MFRLYLEYGRLVSPDRDNGKMVRLRVAHDISGAEELISRTSSCPSIRRKTLCRPCMRMGRRSGTLRRRTVHVRRRIDEHHAHIPILRYGEDVEELSSLGWVGEHVAPEYSVSAMWGGEQAGRWEGRWKASDRGSFPLTTHVHLGTPSTHK
jgi:hypothetical protein